MAWGVHPKARSLSPGAGRRSFVQRTVEAIEPMPEVVLDRAGVLAIVGQILRRQVTGGRHYQSGGAFDRGDSVPAI
jgi:hypothetical protein